MMRYRESKKKRMLALEEFENTTKKDIVNEINERYEEKLSSMKTELQKKKADMMILMIWLKNREFISHLIMKLIWARIL